MWVTAPSRLTPVRCPLPSNMLTQSCASCRSSSGSTSWAATRSLSYRAWSFDVIHARSADPGLCGHMRPAPPQVSEQGNIFHLLIPRGPEAHEEPRYLNKTGEIELWKYAESTLEGSSVPPMSASCKQVRKFNYSAARCSSSAS